MQPGLVKRESERIISQNSKTHKDRQWGRPTHAKMQEKNQMGGFEFERVGIHGVGGGPGTR